MLKIDLSKYFKAQLIFLVPAAVVYVFLFTPFIIFLMIPIGLLGNIAYFILPGALFITDVVYALIKGENFETKACLVLSSPVLAVLGLLLDYYYS